MSPQTIAPAAATGRRVARPRTWSVRASDVVAVGVGNGLLIAAMWVRHGGLGELGTSAGIVTSAGQLSALFGTYLILIELVLMSRSPWLEQLFGMDRLAAAHRWIGFGAIWLLAAHGALTTVGYAIGDGSSVVGEAWVLVTTYPFVLWAVAGMGLFVAVGVSSVRAARQRLSYETWHGIHLYAYLAVALTFAHQLVVGADFAGDPVARLYWIGLYVATAAAIVAFRFGQPIRLSLRHRLRVANVVREGPGVVSVYLTGRDLDQLAIRSGQYLICRFLTRDGWWRGHPFSISAAPNGEWLRITVKDLGDDTKRLQRIAVGTPVYVEGPYGALTARAADAAACPAHRRGDRDHPAACPARGASRPARPAHPHLPGASGRGSRLPGGARRDRPRERRDRPLHRRSARDADLAVDPLGPGPLSELVPDLDRRDVYLCGPIPMMEALRRTLRILGVPTARIHSERFAY